MTILTRYILKLFLTWFLLATAAMTLCIVAAFMVATTTKSGMPARLAFRLMPYSIPMFMTMILPVTSLMASCLCYSKLVVSNEMIALRALGVPPWRAFLPIWILTFLISILTVWCNDLSFSWGTKEGMRVVISGSEEMILSKLAADGKFIDPQGHFTLNVESVSKTGELKTISFVYNNPHVEGQAESGRLSVDFTQNPPIVKIVLNDLVVNTKGKRLVQPENMTWTYPLTQFKLSGFSTNYPGMKEVKGVLMEIQAEREKISRQAAARGAFALLKGDFEYFNGRDWIERWERDNNLVYRNNRARLATPRSFATGFTCFIFAWVGIPLTVWLNQQNYMSSFFITFIPILLIFYPLLNLGNSLAKSGLLPPWACGTADAILLAIGFLLLKKVHRH